MKVFIFSTVFHSEATTAISIHWNFFRKLILGCEKETRLAPGTSKLEMSGGSPSPRAKRGRGAQDQDTGGECGWLGG